MKYNRLIMYMFVFFMGFCSSGCLKLDEIKIHYHIKTDMTGKMKIDFKGIGSDEKTLAEQKAEMKEFYEKDYVITGKEQLLLWCLKNGKVDLSEKTELACNGAITGKIHNLPGSLYPLTEDSGFKIERIGKIFSFKVDSCKISEKDLPVSISVKYDGKIISHNAHQYNPKDQTMIWSGMKMEKTGIHFKVESR